MYGGGVISGGNFFFSSRDKTLQENRILSKQLRDDRPSDYWDHLGVISSKYVSGWDPVLPDFSTPFKPLYLKVFSYRSEDSDFEMNFTVDAKIERDFNPGVNLFSENLAFDDFGPPWGFPWNSKWGSYQESFSRKKIKGSKTRNLRFTFSNSEGGQNCVISAWELSFSTPFGSSMNSSSNDLFIR